MKQLRKLVRLSPGPPIFTFKNVSLARFLHHKFKTWETEINFVKAIRKVINNKFQQYLVWKYQTSCFPLEIFNENLLSFNISFYDDDGFTR